MPWCGRFGRAMRATAESENASRALGINVIAIRTLAFSIAAGFAGLGGGLFANLALFVNYESFTFNDSIELLLMTISAAAAPWLARWSVRGSSLLRRRLCKRLRVAELWLWPATCPRAFVMPDGVVGSLARFGRWALAHGRVGERRTGAWPHFVAGLDFTARNAEAPGQATLITNGLSLRFGA
jgi:hypothetical protein